MRIAVSSESNQGLESSVSAHFGRCPYYVIVDVEDGTVKVRLTGACAGCPMSTMTLKMGIEKRLKEQIPEVKQVVAVQ